MSRSRRLAASTSFRSTPIAAAAPGICVRTSSISRLAASTSSPSVPASAILQIFFNDRPTALRLRRLLKLLDRDFWIALFDAVLERRVGVLDQLADDRLPGNRPGPQGQAERNRADRFHSSLAGCCSPQERDTVAESRRKRPARITGIDRRPECPGKACRVEGFAERPYEPVQIERFPVTGNFILPRAQRRENSHNPVKHFYP